MFFYHKDVTTKNQYMHASVCAYVCVCVCVRAYTGVHKHICSPGRVENIKWL